MISSLARVPGRTSAAGGGERSLPGLPATTASTKSAGKVFSTRAGVSSSPRKWGFGGSGAGGAELGSRSPGEKNPVGRSRAPQLSAGTAGPAPAAQPPPPLSPFLRPPRQPPRPGRQAPWTWGCTDRAGVASKRASTLRLLPPPAALSSPLPDPGCAGRAQGAGSNNARRRKRKARRGPSPERSPLQLQPQVPSLLPAPQTRRWRQQLRKEEPVLQRHSALLTARY